MYVDMMAIMPAGVHTYKCTHPHVYEHSSEIAPKCACVCALKGDLANIHMYI